MERPGVTEVRRLIDGLRRDRRQHPYSGRREYSDRAQAVAAAIEEMISSGRAADAVPLARRAVERVTAALLYMDDSSGIIGGDLRTLMDLYARACRAAPPDARRLAAWLVTSQLDGPGWPAVKLKEFASALGESGLAEVARLTGERRAAADPGSWSAGWGVRDLREQLAAVSGDVDAHVAVLAEELGSAHRYGEVVQVLRAASRDDEAEQWARKGLAEHPSGPQTGTLRDQLVELLLDAGRGGDAVAVHREIFEQRVLHQDYLKLRDTAGQASQWTGLRSWALDLLRERARADARYASDLINVLIRENMLDEAWAAANAQPGRLHESQWFQLIELRETGHPADVITPYQELIELRLEQATDKYRYPKAIKTIKRLREAYRNAGDDAGFATYLADLRERHKRKTSFLAKLDTARTGLSHEPRARSGGSIRPVSVSWPSRLRYVPWRRGWPGGLFLPVGADWPACLGARGREDAGRGEPGWCRQQRGADPWQGDGRGIAFDRLQVRAGRAAGGQEQGVVGQVLQHGGLDCVLLVLPETCTVSHWIASAVSISVRALRAPDSMLTAIASRGPSTTTGWAPLPS